MPTDRVLPSGLVAERATPTFTAESVPPALLRAHHTAAWAELVVHTGSVRFVEEDPTWATTVEVGHQQVIVPYRKHHIEPSADAEFHVQFYVEPEPVPPQP